MTNLELGLSDGPNDNVKNILKPDKIFKNSKQDI